MTKHEEIQDLKIENLQMRLSLLQGKVSDLEGKLDDLFAELKKVKEIAKRADSSANPCA